MTTAASVLQGIATRYNTQYATILTRLVGQQGISADVQSTINSMLTDLTTLMTDLNADDTLGVTIAGYGVPATKVANLNVKLGSGATGVSIAMSAAFTAPTAISTYAVAAGSTLPAGLSLNTSTGAITGTAPTVVSTTTYVFVITAASAFGAAASSTVTLTVG